MIYNFFVKDSIIETLHENSKDVDSYLKSASTKALESWLKLVVTHNKDAEKYSSIFDAPDPTSIKKKLCLERFEKY